MSLESKIERACEICSMDDIYDSVIVGFSGGADSSALVHYLKSRTKNLLCVHINHMIRGEEAIRDEFFCKNICKEYGVKFASFRVDIPLLAEERHQGLEQTAREERYRIFRGLLQQNPEYKCIATAHNANDDAETVIFNLTRGTAAKGIGGIRPVVDKVMRPLILATREEIMEYCRAHEIKYVKDSTNEDVDYTRNYIRHQVVPALEKINPSFVEAVSRLAQTATWDREYFDKIVSKIFEENKIEDKIDLDLIKTLEPPICSRVLQRMSGDRLDYKSIQACLKLLSEGGVGKKINLPQGISFKLERGYAHFVETKNLEKKEFCVKIKEGLNKIKAVNYIIGLNTEEIPLGYTEIDRISLSSDAVSGQLYVRNKEDGDTIFQGKMTKKLKTIMCAKHIPSHKRDKIPLICDDNGILCVPRLVTRDGVKGKDLTITVYEGI
ncbi:MAG: tRNA lysidine(34) synthetase TilS [Clostridia bacterium]|nr:tRNA lysidine(34) synthetase TilS [Clostridia bacterium]